jgi:hypothetical protein
MARTGRIRRRSLAAALATAALGLCGGTAAAAVPEYETAPTTFDATPWSECTQYLRADAAPLASCDDDALSRPIGRVDDDSVLTGRMLLSFQSVTLVQDSPIQDAELLLHVVSRGSIAPARILVHRVTSYWTAGSGTAAQVTWDPVPLAALTPSWDGTVSLDITWLADAWSRAHVTAGRDGLWDNGLLVRLEHEPLQGGCQTPLCPQAQIAGSRHPDPALRPVVRSLSWNRARNDTAVDAVPLDGDLRRIALWTSSPSLSAGATRFQYLAGERSHWKDVPLSALSDDDGAPLADELIPFSGSLGWRWAGAVWDAVATLGDDAAGVVRVRAIQYSRTWYDGGVTRETSFRFPAPDPRPGAVDPPDESGSANRAPGRDERDDHVPVGDPPAEPSPRAVAQPPVGPASGPPQPSPAGAASRPQPAPRRARRPAARAGGRAPRKSRKAKDRRSAARRAPTRCATKRAAKSGARRAKPAPRPRGCRR